MKKTKMALVIVLLSLCTILAPAQSAPGKALEGSWWFTRETSDSEEETVITITAEGKYEKTITAMFMGGTGGWGGERGTITLTGTALTFTPEAKGEGGMFNMGDDEAFTKLNEAEQAKARYTVQYRLSGGALTLDRQVYRKR